MRLRACGLHLVHHPASMGFHGDFGDAELATYWFVQCPK